jgi:hypothetical protein
MTTRLVCLYLRVAPGGPARASLDQQKAAARTWTARHSGPNPPAPQAIETGPGIVRDLPAHGITSGRAAPSTPPSPGGHGPATRARDPRMTLTTPTTPTAPAGGWADALPVLPATVRVGIIIRASTDEENSRSPSTPSSTP